MFGGLDVVPLVPTPDGGPGGRGGSDPERWTPSAPVLPPQVAHIARDPLDPTLDEKALVARGGAAAPGSSGRCSTRRLVSGVGNIYADEALWRARLHYARATDAMTRPGGPALLDAVREVMADALAAGRHELRLALRERQRRERLLRPVAGRLRPGGPAVPALRHADPSGQVHEPLVLLLPARPAAAARRALVTSAGTCPSASIGVQPAPGRQCEPQP